MSSSQGDFGEPALGSLRGVRTDEVKQAFRALSWGVKSAYIPPGDCPARID